MGKKFAVLAAFSLSISLLLAPIANATDTISFTKINFTTGPGVNSLAFKHDESSLYFAEQGVTGVHEILSSQLVSGGTPISSTSDGFTAFRTAHTDWQITFLAASSAAGVGGSYWIYAGTGNRNVPASPIDAAGKTDASGVWAINTSDNSVIGIPVKRSDGKWQQGQAHAGAITPDGKYVYVQGWRSTDPDPYKVETFKISTATHQQVGLGIPGPYAFENISADNRGVYSVTGTGVLKIGIDADNSSLTGDSAASYMTLSGDAATFDFSKSMGQWNSGDYLYITSTTSVILKIDTRTGAGTLINLGTTATGNGSLWAGTIAGDGCAYLYNDALKSIQKYDLGTAQLLASTGTISNFTTRWDRNVTMNAAGTKVLYGGEGAYDGFLIFDVSTSAACSSGGSSGGSGGSSGSGGGSNTTEEQARENERKRQDLIRQARLALIQKISKGGKIETQELKPVELPNLNSTNLDLANKEVLKLTPDKLNTFDGVEKIAIKYSNIQNLESDSPKMILADQLIETGLVSDNTPFISNIQYRMLQLPADARNTPEKIQNYFSDYVAKIEARKARTASIIEKIQNRINR